MGIIEKVSRRIVYTAAKTLPYIGAGIMFLGIIFFLGCMAAAFFTPIFLLIKWMVG